MGSVTMLRPGSMVTRALAVVVPDDDKQRDYLKELRVRCNQLADHPERFPELYGDVHQLWPKRSVCDDYAKIMAVECEHSDLVDRRVGWPRRDGSCYGVSLRTLARKTDIGNPDVRTGRDGRDFPGRRRLLRRLRRLHEAKYLQGRKQLHLIHGVAGNRRWKIEETDRLGRPNRLAGQWISQPTVRQIGESFVKRVALDARAELEKKDAKAWRAGRVDHFVDVRRRRLRDREIKLRQRNKAREERIYYVDQERALAAKQSRRQE